MNLELNTKLDFTKTQQKVYDVAICGGGLAGLTLARQLKQNIPNLSIVVLDRFSRPLPESAIKVGESTVELGAYYLSETLQLADYFKQYHLPKLGLRYFLGDAQKPFEERPELGISEFPTISSYQIDRGKLENDLWEFNIQSGIRLIENCQIKSIELTDYREKLHQIVYTQVKTKETGIIQALWVIDATGRRRFLQKQLDLAKPNNPKYNAVWFWINKRIDVSNFVSATNQEWHDRVPSHQRYYSTNHLCGKGYWIWLIPLPSNHTSIGIVFDGDVHSFSKLNTYEKSFDWLQQYEPILADHLRSYQPQKFMKMPKYSYSSTQVFSVNRWACVGEAGVFPDPFYSPGTDLIGFTNSFVTWMIERDLQGKLTQEMVDYANNFILVYNEGATANIQNVYECFDNPLVLSLKVIWDTLIGWAFNTPLIFNPIFLDAQKYSNVLKSSGRFFLLNHRIQELFRDWSIRSQRRGSFEFIDYLKIEFVRELRTRNLQSGKTLPELIQDYAISLKMFEELAQVIFLLALEDTMPEQLANFPESPWLNAWGISLDPAKWNTDGLFRPTSQPRDLNQIKQQLDQFIHFDPFLPSEQKLAISHAESLLEDPNTPKTLIEALQQTVKQNPEKTIVYLQSNGLEIDQRYSDLLAQAQVILAGLRKSGLKPQDKVILQLELNQDFVPTFWGCILGGFIPVSLAVSSTYQEVNSAVNKLKNTWEMLSKPIVISSERLFNELNSLSQKLNLENWQVINVNQLRQNEPDVNYHPSQPEDVTLMLLTSGSTGMPKAVQLSHKNILSRAKGRAKDFDFSSLDISLNWFSLDHVASLVMCHLRDVYLGCQQIHAPTHLVLENPLNWLDWIDRYRATVTWAPNFAYRLVNEQAEKIRDGHWDLSSMQCIFNGGEAIDGKTAKNFLDLLGFHKLPSTSLYPDWGMTEIASGVVCANSFTPKTAQNTFVDLGKPIPEVSFRITDENNQVLLENQIGRVQVKGPMVMVGYYNNPEMNAEVFTSDGWFNTGDLGFLQDGRLTLTGRAKEIIIINGLNYANHEIEANVEELAGVQNSYTAACAVRPPGSQTDHLAIFFSSSLTEDAEILKQIKTIRSKIVKSFGVNPDYIIPLSSETIPKTSIGKIQRSKLKSSLEAGELDRILEKFAKFAQSIQIEFHNFQEKESIVPQTEIELQIASIWKEVLNISSVSINDNFFELGGNSILVAQLVNRFRKIFQIDLPIQILFETPTIKGLANYLDIAHCSSQELTKLNEQMYDEYVEGVI
ncbi:MAG: AMP-binding protein [Xenococcus sp. MO_188.B8]|nr:AMP-binding protein [Xenococcus sp. MO_188.B8]